MGEQIREQVRRALVDREPIDEGEALKIAEFLELYDELADPFDQRSDPIHVTGSAIIVGPRGTILLRHKRLGLWLQPGGHIDPGETPWMASLREAIEETGLPLRHAGDGAIPRLVHVDVHAGGRGHTHLDLRYLLVVDNDEGDADPKPPAGESQDIGWFARDAAIERASDVRLQAALAAVLPVIDTGF